MLVSGQWALVTGASSGLGEKFAEHLASRGLSLVLSARSRDVLGALAARLGSAHGVGARVIAADLSTAAGIDGLVRDVEALHLPIDHLIGCAGYGARGLFVEGDADLERRMVRLNCEANVALAHALVPGMLARRRGGVVMVSSTLAFQPSANFATYAATKAFLLSFTEALHEELRGSGVRAMTLCPGPVPTGFQKRARMRLAFTPPGMVLSAEQTVRSALDDYERGAVLCVPGVLNRAGAFLARHAPRGLVRRATFELMRRATRPDHE